MMQHGSDVRPNPRVRWMVLSIIPGTHCVEVRALLLSEGRLILVVLIHRGQTDSQRAVRAQDGTY